MISQLSGLIKAIAVSKCGMKHAVKLMHIQSFGL